MDSAYPPRTDQHFPVAGVQQRGAGDNESGPRPVFRGSSRSNGPPASSQTPTPPCSPFRVNEPEFSDASTRSSASPGRPRRHLRADPKQLQSTAAENSELEDDDFSDSAPRSRSSMAVLGEWAETLSTGLAASLSTWAESPNEIPETGEAQDDDNRSEQSEIADLVDGTSQPGSQPAGEEFASSIRRMSSFIMEGWWPEPEEEGTPGASSSSEPQVIDFDKMRKEVRKPFQRLLADIPSTEADMEDLLKSRTTVDTKEPQEDGLEVDARSPLLSALAKSRLIGRVLGCCDAVISELSPQEVRLWEAFIVADSSLAGSLHVRGSALRKLLGQLSRSTERITEWMEAIALWADDNEEVDFADLLDWFAGEQLKNNMWSLQTSLRSSFSQLLSSHPGNMRMSAELVATLRHRLANMPANALAKAASTYQRTLVLTSWCQCERRLLSLITPAENAASSSEGRCTERGLVRALIAVLRGINAELAPTERVLWELLGSKDSNFDGTLDKQEVLAAIGELLVYSIERELGTPEGEFEELQRLRADCRRRSVDSLFEDQRHRRVTLADVLRWWWDMSEEYRVAAGLSVPAALLRRSLNRRPEEMFRDKLPRMAASQAAALVGLKGHCRVLAELRALATSRAVENLQGRNSETATSCTTTSCTSEVTGESKSRDADETESEEEAPVVSAHDRADSGRPSPAPREDSAALPRLASQSRRSSPHTALERDGATAETSEEPAQEPSRGRRSWSDLQTDGATAPSDAAQGRRDSREFGQSRPDWKEAFATSARRRSSFGASIDLADAGRRPWESWSADQAAGICSQGDALDSRSDAQTGLSESAGAS